MKKSKYTTPNTLYAEDIKSKRAELGLTQKEFAELIGASKPTVERWETTDKEISGPIVLLLQMLTPSYVESIRIPEKVFPTRMWYMYKNKKCTLIDVDELNRTVRIKNYARNIQFCAFGINSEPTYEEYEEFLESRCFPRTRDKMKIILEDLDLPFYDPLLIIEKTKGRMAEDDFWIEVE